MQIFVAKIGCILLDRGFDEERDEECDNLASISHVHCAVEARLAW